VAGRTSRSGNRRRVGSQSRARLLALLALVASAGAAGCGASAAGGRLEHTFAGSEEAARAVLEAVWTRDTERLLQLAVTEEEFRSVVWPRLPASRPEVGMPLDYLWRDTFARSRAGVGEVLRDHGGRRLHLDSVVFGGPSTDYGTFSIHPETRLTVTDDRGHRATVRLFGSMIESGGRWKVYGFVVD
jgi:hypothetical protein